jgi:glyoxylase-like metal-dependent hydrolase (beta-lactamase superfamily II)
VSIVELRPHLYRPLLGRYQAYLWRDEQSVTLIDTGEAGSGPPIADELARSAWPAATWTGWYSHFHDDHAG